MSGPERALARSLNVAFRPDFAEREATARQISELILDAVSAALPLTRPAPAEPGTHISNPSTPFGVLEMITPQPPPQQLPSVTYATFSRDTYATFSRDIDQDTTTAPRP